MTIKVLELVSGIFLAKMNIRFQVWHMTEIVMRDFREHRQMQVHIIQNQLEKMGMMWQIAEKVEMDYPEVLDSRYVSQPLSDFLFS